MNHALLQASSSIIEDEWYLQVRDEEKMISTLLSGLLNIPKLGCDKGRAAF